MMFGLLAYGSFQALQSYRNRGGRQIALKICIVSAKCQAACGPVRRSYRVERPVQLSNIGDETPTRRVILLGASNLTLIVSDGRRRRAAHVGRTGRNHGRDGARTVVWTGFDRVREKNFWNFSLRTLAGFTKAARSCPLRRS